MPEKESYPKVIFTTKRKRSTYWYIKLYTNGMFIAVTWLH